MTFDYHRSLAPMMWAFLSIALVEAVVVHLLVAMWSPAVAVALSAVSLAGIVWLVRMVRSFARLPVVLGDEGLVMRCGNARSITTDVANIAGFRDDWTAESIKDRSVLKMSLLAYPNVVLDLVRPVAIDRRVVRAVAHRLDRPDLFRAALEPKLAR